MRKISLDTDKVDSEAGTAADVEQLCRVKKFPQQQVLTAIEDLKQSLYDNAYCNRCSYSSNNSKDLALHMARTHKGSKPRWCYPCNAEFDDLSDHITTYHSDDYACKFCYKKFQAVQNLTQHLHSHSDVKSIPCPLCDMSFSKKSRLSMHLKMHTKERFKCDSCNESFSRMYLLRNHWKVQKCRDDGSYDKVCTLCGKRFQYSFKLECHMQRHKIQATHKCTYCDKKFKTASEMKSHKLTHTGERSHVCQVCGRSFPVKGTLLSHMVMIHNIGTKKSCNICNKKFRWSYDLRQHLEIHSGEKLYVCTECGKSFLQKSYLAKHVKIHSELRPFKCNDCDKSFVRKFQLKCHMWIHSGEKPYKCNQCSYACRTNGSLTRHMKIHKTDKPQADRPHVCLLCNGTYTTDANLKSHINNHTVSFLDISS